MPAGIICFIGFLLSLLSYFFIENLYVRTTLLVLFASTASGAYMVKGAINEWYYRRFPRRLSKSDRAFLEKYFKQYANFPEERKIKFEQIFYLMRLELVFESQVLESVPGDIMMLCCAYGTLIMMEQEPARFTQLGVVTLYPTLFKSPKLHAEAHAFEFNYDDEEFHCIILANDAFVKGHTTPKAYYNVGLHAFARALQVQLKMHDDVVPRGKATSLIEFIAMMSHIRGFQDVPEYQFMLNGGKAWEVFPMCVEHYFMSPKPFKEMMPETYNFIEKILKTNPDGLKITLDNWVKVEK